MHYLVDVASLDTRVLDNNLHSPLHIACARGHLEAFKYLIRKEVFYIRNYEVKNIVHM